MVEVCPHGPPSVSDDAIAALHGLYEAARALPSDLQGGSHTLGFARRKYQDTVETAYGLLPRPPQTSAARFKRLYRK